jgi:hypothetical protein
MCRSIKRLREGSVPAGPEEVREAALQFVRKISGYRVPSNANEEVFERAVDDIAGASTRLLESLVVGRSPAMRRADA